jgi:hypothetical protein
MEFYIVYDKTTGEEKMRGQGPVGAIVSQTALLPEELALMPVSMSVFNSHPLNIEQIRIDAAVQIDRGAEIYRLRFVTAGAGQAMTYTAKAEEARAYLADNTVATPWLTAEADAIGSTVEEVANEVATMSARWTIIGSRIEGARMGAKHLLGQATDLAAIANAMAIDWDGVGETAVA